jgi:hypothetical protein
LEGSGERLRRLLPQRAVGERREMPPARPPDTPGSSIFGVEGLGSACCEAF